MATATVTNTDAPTAAKCLVIANGAVYASQTATAAVTASSGTIAVTSGVSRVSPTGAVTGVILAVGIQQGQTVTVVNEAIAANTVTFAVSGTSHVADGVSDVIAGLTARTFHLGHRDIALVPERMMRFDRALVFS